MSFFVLATILIIVSCKGKEVKTKTVNVSDNVQIVHYDWKVAKYSYVKAYLIPDDLVCLCMANDSLKKEFIDKLDSEKNRILPPVVLSEKQIAEIGSLFTKKMDEDSYSFADCFNPRHAIVYYDQHKKPVNAILVCFECGRLEAVPAVMQNLNFYTENFRSLFEQLGLPVFDNPIEYQAYIDSLKRLKKPKK